MMRTDNTVRQVAQEPGPMQSGPLLGHAAGRCWVASRCSRLRDAQRAEVSGQDYGRRSRPTTASTALTAARTAGPTHAAVAALGGHLGHPSPDRLPIGPREQALLQSDRERQHRQSGGLDRGGTVEHHRVVEVPDQLLVQPPVHLARSVYGHDPQQPVIVVPEDAHSEELLLHGAARAARKMPDPVVGLVGRTCAAHPLDGALEQRLVRGPLRDDRYPSSVADDPMPKRQVEQERAAEPEVEVRGLDQGLPVAASSASR